ncbi:MAG: TolC family protein [Deltaproteobacteria bacterium]|nr:TolC family protein [Deltaproteobacteria bacterium]
MNSSIMMKIQLLLAVFAMILGAMTSVRASEAKKEVMVLSLDRALQIALEKNRDIQKAREYRNQVEGRYVEERAAALPQFLIQASFYRARDESLKVYSQIYPLEAEFKSAGVGVSQVLYSFGQVDAAIRAAKVGLKTADDQLLFYQQAALKDVSSAFYDALLSRELYALARQNLEQRSRHLEEARKKYAAGTATDYDVLAAEVTVENARPDVIRTENIIRISRDRLRFLLGLEGQEVDTQGNLLSPTILPLSYEDSIGIAWKNRPELSNFKHRIGIAEELVTIYKAMNKPRLDFKAGYGWKSQDIFINKADGPNWTIGLYATFPFFDGLRTQGKVAQAKSEVASLKIEEAKLLDAIVLQVHESVNAVRESGEIVKGLSGTVSQAQRLLAMAEKGYEFGVKTRLEVDDAQLNLMLAQGNLAKARRDHLAAQTNLQWAMGVIQVPASSGPSK